MPQLVENDKEYFACIVSIFFGEAIVDRRRGGGWKGTHKEIPDQLAERVGEGEEIDGKLAGINIVLDEGVVRLVVVDQLNDVEEVVLIQLAEGVGHLLEVPTSLALLSIIGLPRLRRTRVVIVTDGAGGAEEADQGLGGVLEADGMDVVVLGGGEVQVVVDGDLTTLLGSKHIDGHLELAPTLILTGEWRLVEG